MRKDTNASVAELLRLGKLGLELGCPEQAEAYFDQVLKLAPGHPVALLGMARVCRDPRAALEMVESVLLARPGSADAVRLRDELRQTLHEQAAQAPLASQSLQPPDAVPSSRHVVPRLDPAVPPVFEATLRGPQSASEMDEGLGPRAGRQQHWMVGGLIVNALCGVVLLAMIATVALRLPRYNSPTATRQSLASRAPSVSGSDGTGDLSASLRDSELSIMQVLVPDPLAGISTKGSGVIVDDDGLVLTNQHVISGLGPSPAARREGLVFLGRTTSARSPVSDWYIGVLLVEDSTRDLAVLRILVRADGGAVSGMSFRAMPVDESDTLDLGRALVGLGYPTLGGDTITLTRGTMAGFVTDTNGVRLGKTDSQLLPGASGGAVLTDEGRLVGVITGAFSDRSTQGRLSFFVIASETSGIIHQAHITPTPRPGVTSMVDLFRRTMQ